jgi:hypothetical protein
MHLKILSWYPSPNLPVRILCHEDGEIFCSHWLHYFSDVIICIYFTLLCRVLFKAVFSAVIRLLRLLPYKKTRLGRKTGPRLLARRPFSQAPGRVDDLRVGWVISICDALSCQQHFPIALWSCTFSELLESVLALALLPKWLAVSSVYTWLHTNRIV